MSKITPRPVTDGPLVAALVYDGLCTFEYSIAAEVFGLSRPEMGAGWYRFTNAPIDAGPMRAHGGLRVEVEGGVEALETADLIVIPGWRGVDAEVPASLIARLRAAHARGAKLASICSGAFVLAATGLLDGKRATTHWHYAEALARRFPHVEVDASVLYAETDRVFTSAGSAAGIDMMLHIVRGDFGAAAANSVARRLVTPPHRSGGQAQFILRPVGENGGRLAGLLEMIRSDLTKSWAVPDMAREAAMSPRTFLRRFTETTGQSPGDWVTMARVEEAKRLLEMTKFPIEEVATRVGFGSVTTLRHHFRAQVKLSPREYRDQFG